MRACPTKKSRAFHCDAVLGTERICVMCEQHVRVAALVHRAGDARVVHFVETLHGLVAVVLSALQQVMRGHGAAVVVDVVAALAVGEDLDALDEAGGVGRGRGQRVGAVRVPDAEGDLDGLGVDEGRAAGQRDAADPRGCGGEGAQRAGEVLRVMPRRHVAGVACFQLVVQSLHQLILGSGGDYLHACLYTRILTRTAKEKLFLQCVYRYTDERTSVLQRKSGKKAITPGRILIEGLHLRRPWRNSVLQRKTVQKPPRQKFYFIFFKQPQCLAPAGQSWAEAGSGVTARNWSSPASSGTGAGPRGAACCWTAPARGSRTARRRGCLRGCRMCCGRCAA